MKEDLLQFAWLYKLYSQVELLTDTNERIEVIDPGQLNHDSGPDFFNAKVKIDGTLWVGNIEIHACSSDWIRHKHHTNKQYNNVILHVVHSYDQPTYNELKNRIPTLVMQISSSLVNEYNSLLMRVTAIPCGQNLHNIKEIYLFSWLTTILYEKLEKKYATICDLLLRNHNNWNETFYILLTRNFGFGINSEPFELLAKSLPLNIILKHSDSLFQVEALLFGQAGFLDEMLAEDDYYNSLRKEYLFLATKYRLKPLERHMWHFMRLRPNNFPTVRIAQLCNLLHGQQALLSGILEAGNPDEIFQLISAEANDYWANHYRFNIAPKTSPGKRKLGQTSKTLIILNTIVPFLFTYGKSVGKDIYVSRSLALLEKIKPEKNSIINRWGTHNIVPENAFQSQALIYLYNNYCKVKKCLSCQIGHQILTKKG
ncbi:DUF2851 family protein [Saccharicrinis sp. FJH54]|uniref:DUF2851 family protein n=1 Tax=Saccharicrinis sp. FJH54 TaxID=3344665 RepID=UPI0035D3E0EE